MHNLQTHPAHWRISRLSSLLKDAPEGWTLERLCKIVRDGYPGRWSEGSFCLINFPTPPQKLIYKVTPDDLEEIVNQAICSVPLPLLDLYQEDKDYIFKRFLWLWQAALDRQILGNFPIVKPEKAYSDKLLERPGLKGLPLWAQESLTSPALSDIRQQIYAREREKRLIMQIESLNFLKDLTKGLNSQRVNSSPRERVSVGELPKRCITILKGLGEDFHAWYRLTPLLSGSLAECRAYLGLVLALQNTLDFFA